MPWIRPAGIRGTVQSRGAFVTMMKTTNARPSDDLVWSKNRNALKRREFHGCCGFRSLPVHKPRSHKIQPSQFTMNGGGRYRNAMAAPAGVHHWKSRQGIAAAQRIPGGGELHPARQDQRAAATDRRGAVHA